MSSNLNQAVYIEIKYLVHCILANPKGNSFRTQLDKILLFSGIEGRKYLLLTVIEIFLSEEDKIEQKKIEKRKLQIYKSLLECECSEEYFFDYFPQIWEKNFYQSSKTHCEFFFSSLNFHAADQIIIMTSLLSSRNLDIASYAKDKLKECLINHFEMGMPVKFKQYFLGQFIYYMKTDPDFEENSEEIKFILETNSYKELVEENIIVSEIEDYLSEEFSLVSKIEPILPEIPLQDLIKDIDFTVDFNFTEFLNNLQLVSSKNTIRDIINGYFKNPVVNDRLSFHALNSSRSFVEMNDYINKLDKLDHYQFLVENIQLMDFERPSGLYSFLIYIREGSQRKGSDILKHFVSEWQDPLRQAKTLSLLLSSELFTIIAYPGSNVNNLNVDLIKRMIELENTQYGPEFWNKFAEMKIHSCSALLLALSSIETNSYDTVLALLIEILLYVMDTSFYEASIIPLQYLALKNAGIILKAFYQIYTDFGDEYVPAFIEFGILVNKEITKGCLFHKSEKFGISYAFYSSLKNDLDFDSWCSKRGIYTKKHVAYILDMIESSILMRFKENEDKFLTYCELYFLKLENLYKILQTCQKLNKKTNKPKQIQERISNLSREVTTCFPEIDLKGGLTIQEYVAYMLEKLYSDKLQVEDYIKIVKRYKNHPLQEVKSAFQPLAEEPFNLVKNFKSIKIKPTDVEKLKHLIVRTLDENLLPQDKMNNFFKTMITYLKSKENSSAKQFAIELLKMLKEKLYAWNDFTLKLFSIDYLKDNHIELLEEIRVELDKTKHKIKIPPEYFLFIDIKSQGKKIPNQEDSIQETEVKKFIDIKETPPEEKPSVEPIKPIIIPPKAEISYSKHQESSFNFANLMINTSPGGQNTGGSLSTQTTISKSASQPTESHRNKASEATTINLDSLIKGYDKDLKDLSKETQQKIIFPLNNCSKNNIDDKATEIRLALKDENVILWFAKYLVFQRAPLEPNLHSMYIDLVEKIKNKLIFKLMIIDTCKLCNMILGIENAENFNRATLKNLGTWLGLLTLARNRPIISKYFNVRETIISAYDKKQIELIIPFICKILVCGKDSIFKPNNAWMSAMLSLLSEIMDFPDNKVALNCEIELVFKTFNIRKDDIPPSRVFRERERRKGYGSETKSLSRGLSDGRLIINELPQYINYDQSILTKLNLNPNDFRNVISQALDRAINDIINLVISRSVTIALITTKELVLKDFALEPDEMKLIKGANFIIQNLAGNLALITTREPLKSSFIQNLKAILEHSGLDETEKDNLVQAVGMDVIDLGCALIKKTVIGKAIDDVNNDPTILEAIEKRKAFREKNMTYYDETVFKTTQQLPEPLRPTLGGLTRDQFKIYEEFGKNLKTNGMMMRNDRILDSASLEVIAKFEQYVVQLDRELEGLSDAPNNNDKIRDLQNMHKRAMDLISHTNKSEMIIFDCALRIIDPLFSDKINLKKINFFVAVLQELRRFDENLTADVLEWIASDDKRILKAELVIRFIKEKFLPYSQLDLKLGDIIRNCRLNPLVYHSIVRIIKVTVDEKMVPLNLYANTIEAILTTYKNIKDTKILKFLEEFKNAVANGNTSYNMPRPPNINPSPVYMNNLKKVYQLFKDPSEIYEEAYNILLDWFNIETEEEMPNFSSNIHNKMFQSDSNMIRFFTYLTDVCVAHSVESTIDNETNPNSAMDFTYVDAESRLLILLLKGVKESEGLIDLFDKIMQSIIISLTKYHHFDRERFNGRPFFRILYNIICDLARKEYLFNSKDIEKCFLILIRVFEELKPLNYPGFSFCWLELISNRYFMPFILNSGKELSQNYGYLMISLFRFFKEVVDTDYQKTDTFRYFYRGCLRVLSVILHDFTDFLCEGSFYFVEYLPDSFVQVRNMILSAYPKTLTPGDPSRFPEQNELKEEFQILPSMLYPIEERIVPLKIDEDIFRYFKSQGENRELTYRSLCSKLVKTESNITSINHQAVNAFILYLPYLLFQNNSDIKAYEAYRIPSYELLQKIISSSNSEMKECIITAIINQIKYPNVVTFYYTSFVMKLFAYPSGDDVQELTQKILVERVKTDRPHPWGLVYVMQKINNKRPEFQEHLKTVTKPVNRSDGGDN